MAAIDSDLQKYFQLLLLNNFLDFFQTVQEASTLGPVPSLCLSQSINKAGRH